MIAKGKRHKCNTSTRVDNLKTMVQQTIPKGRDQIISSLLKEKMKQRTDSKPVSNCTMALCQRAGRPLRISVNPQKEMIEKPMISTSDMCKIQTSFHLTQNTTLGIASMLRAASGKRKLIEPNLKEKISASIHCLDEFFQAKYFDFIKIKANNVSDAKQCVVYCKNLDGLIEWVKTQRQVSQMHLKFGIDGGGNFLKLCLSIQSIEDDDSESDRVRQKYKDGVASKRFRDSGVKKLFILGIAQSTQENYENVAQLWSAININTSMNKFESTIATDLKLANIISGIMSHSSLFPCTWCVGEKKNLSERAKFRTIGSILNHYSDWRNAGGAANTAKLYMNCIHAPIFTGDSDQLILDIIPPPELHLMLGVVNTVFEHMMVEFDEETSAWTKSCNVEREVTNGGSGFNGNSCKKLLERLDYLRATCPIGCLKFVKVLDDFHLVVKACFGKLLYPNFKKNIRDFKRSYLDLGVSVTPKVHAVFYHVEDFCSKNQKGLGGYSEQAMESVHFDFNIIWNKYKVHNNHPEYERHLLNAVCEFNGLHV